MSLWYRNMFKKMHKIESPSESSILRHRFREESPAPTISRPLTPLTFTARSPSRHECEVTPRRAKSVGRIIEPEMLGEGGSTSTTAEDIAELKRISKEELLYRQKAERLAEELQEQRNRRHGYIPTASPSLVGNKDRFGGLLEEYSRRTSPSPMHPMAVRTATVLFKFDAKSPKELSLNRGDVVRIRRDVDANWLEGERNGQSGLFPRSYVQLDDEFDRSRCKAKAIYPFTARRATELSLKMASLQICYRKP
nr:Src homology-3 domain containing protein [Haemonchus contortus]